MAGRRRGVRGVPRISRATGSRHGGRCLPLSFAATTADRMAGIATEPGAPTTLALGDAPNDVGMPEAADRGVIVPPPSAPLPRLAGDAADRPTRARKPEPDGWIQAILDGLETLPPQPRRPRKEGPPTRHPIEQTGQVTPNRKS